MDSRVVFSPELTVPDTLLLRNLADDIQRHKDKKIKGLGKLNNTRDEGYSSATSTSTAQQEAGIGACFSSLAPGLPARWRGTPSGPASPGWGRWRTRDG